MIRILHAADLHLDAPFRGLPARLAAQRRREQRELPARLAELARARQVHAVLLAGDLFDGGELCRETGQALSRALGSAGCPVFLSPGNHDCWAAGSPYRAVDWPDNVHIFTQPRPAPVELPGLNAVVWGAAFTSPFREESPLAGFRAPEDGKLHLLVAHADLAPHSRYGPLTPEEIAASGLDYLALGHIHACSGVKRAGGTFWAYPGCPEGRGFDETGEKGVLCGTLGRGEAQLEFVPLCRRRYLRLEADVSRTGPEQAARAALAGHEEDVCRVAFTGEAEPPDLPRLERALEDCCFRLSLRDRTVPRRDLWERAEEDTLTGLFLQEMKERLAGMEDAGTAARLTLAVRFGLAALERGEDIRP